MPATIPVNVYLNFPNPGGGGERQRKSSNISIPALSQYSYFCCPAFTLFASSHYPYRKRRTVMKILISLIFFRISINSITRWKRISLEDIITVIIVCICINYSLFFLQIFERHYIPEFSLGFQLWFNIRLWHISSLILYGVLFTHPLTLFYSCFASALFTVWFLLILPPY